MRSNSILGDGIPADMINGCSLCPALPSSISLATSAGAYAAVLWFGFCQCGALTDQLCGFMVSGCADAACM
jgi:hypothetical protein